MKDEYKFKSNSVIPLDEPIHVNVSIESSSWFIVINAIFNNISVISWRSVLLMEEIGVPGENHGPVASH